MSESELPDSRDRWATCYGRWYCIAHKSARHTKNGEKWARFVGQATNKGEGKMNFIALMCESPAEKAETFAGRKLSEFGFIGLRDKRDVIG